MHIGGQEHFYLETNVTLAVPSGEDGEMELFVSTQAATKTQVREAVHTCTNTTRCVLHSTHKYTNCITNITAGLLDSFHIYNKNKQRSMSLIE